MSIIDNDASVRPNKTSLEHSQRGDARYEMNEKGDHELKDEDEECRIS